MLRLISRNYFLTNNKMADHQSYDRGLRFPRKQNPRQQFNETHESSFGVHNLRNPSYPVNPDGTNGSLMTQEGTNARNLRFRSESLQSEMANNDHRRYDQTPPGFHSPPVDFRITENNIRQPLGAFSKQSTCEPFRPQFRSRSPNSNLPIRPATSRNVSDYQNQFPHQHQSQTGPLPFHGPRMQSPVDYPLRPCGPPPVRMTHPPAGLPPVCPPYPQQSFSHPPSQPLSFGSSVMHPPPVQNVGYQDVMQFQQNAVPAQSNQSTLSQHHDKQEKFMKSSTETQRDIDEKWIANWLNGRLGKKTIENKQLKINEAQDIIQKSMVLLATLQKQKKHLESILTSADPVTWQHEANAAEETKIQLCNEQKKLTDEVVDSLDLKLLARQKKRERIKRKRKADYEEKLQEEKNRELKNQAIDKWRRQIVQKNLEEKQNKEIKASADVFLSEVRKKLSDVKKSTDLLNALQKLRKIRKDFAEKQGRYSSVVYDEHFQKMMDNLTKLLKKQQDLYLEEEKTLKVMLENDWVEALEKEKEEKEHTDLVKQKRQQRKHQEMLFGKQEIPSSSSDMYPFYQYYTQAKQNFDALIQIRHGWDMYLVPESFPGSSRIPDGWVLPSEPSSERWASTLKQ